MLIQDRDTEAAIRPPRRPPLRQLLSSPRRRFHGARPLRRQLGLSLFSPSQSKSSHPPIHRHYRSMICWAWARQYSTGGSAAAKSRCAG